MPVFHPDELSQWVSKGWDNGIPAGCITGISHDTRTLEPGHVYVAICGESFDGHDFVEQAFKKGASGAVVRDNFDGSADGPLLRVPDTLKGLQDMAFGYRGEWKGTVIGITGSVGKTTLKEMCADVLSMKAETHRTAGNYNNHIGLPLSMLAMPRDAGFGVFEIGMNHPGEIAGLAELLQPDVGILTDICNAHRESFHSLKEIAREKAQLAWGVPPVGTVILDRDSEWFELIREQTVATMKTVSLGGTADYVGYVSDASVLSVSYPASRLPPSAFTMPMPGEHVMKNALRAIALGLELGMAPADIAEGLRKFKLPSMRWEESDIRGIKFINDAYNANPLSMRANLRTFADLAGGGGKWVVVGGMRELGETSEKEHAELGRFIDDLGLDGVVAVGELGRQIDCRGRQAFFHVMSPGEAAGILNEHLHAGDQVLLKASRGERLEQVLEYFKEI